MFPPLEVLAETPDTIHLPPGTEQEQTDNPIRSHPGATMSKIRKKDLHFILMRLRDRMNHWGVATNDNAQEIKNILRTLKNHGESHQAQDILPQFTALCKKVESVRDRMDVIESQGPHTCHNHAALGEDRKRIIELEESTAGLWEKGTEQDAGILSMLKSIPEIEILKTQVNGLEKEMENIIPGKNNNLWYRVVELERNKANAISLSGLAGDEIRGRINELESALPKIERMVRTLRLDCFSAIRKQNNENAAAHIQQSDTIMHMKEQIKGLEHRLGRAQDMIAEMQLGAMKHVIECPPTGCVTVCGHGSAYGGGGSGGNVVKHSEPKKPAAKKAR